MGTELLNAIGAGLAVSAPLCALLVILHKQRSSNMTSLNKKVDKLDLDLTGLAKQMGGIVTDVEQRFLAKSDHASAMRDLGGHLINLGERIERLNDRIFDLIREGQK